MVKTIRLKDLDCANCAAKMERAIKKIKGVNDCNVNFMLQKMMIDIDDANFDEVMKEVKRVSANVEPECEILY